MGHPEESALSSSRILRTWWPLALSWIVMTAELPLVSAVLAHMADAEINLAAWGIIFSLSVIVQAPSTMLLAASTALSKDWRSYRTLRRYMMAIGAALTLIHALVAFTPLYDLIVGDWMAVPDGVLEPARLGLMIMLPWSWGTAYRRFEQGVLIRFGHPRSVTWGALIRLGVDMLILLIGYRIGGTTGTLLAAGAIATGVVSEAIYAGWRARPVVRDQVKQEPEGEPLTLRAFLAFYIPLALTILLGLFVQPLVSAALSRMPGALVSLAVWPVVFGLLAMFQSAGVAYNEVVIALLEEPAASPALRRFTFRLAGAITLVMLLLMSTPLLTLWLRGPTALPPELLDLARTGLWLGLLLPGLRILQSWYQGVLLYRQKTAPITESVLLLLVATGAILWGGSILRGVAGLYVAQVAITVGFVAQTAWLWWRSRAVLRALQGEECSTLTRPAALPAYATVPPERALRRWGRN